MAKKNKYEDNEIVYNIDHIYGTLKESDKHDWITALLRVSWYDNPSTVDIRKCNLGNKRMGKGISLSNEEVDTMVDILLQNDFGSLDELEEAVKRRKSLFTPIENDEDDEDDDYKYIINIEFRA